MNNCNKIYFFRGEDESFNGESIEGYRLELSIYTDGKVQDIKDSNIVYENIETFINAINDDLQKQETRIEKGYVYPDHKTALIILNNLKKLLYAMGNYHARGNNLPLLTNVR